MVHHTTALVNFNHAIKDGMVAWPDMRNCDWNPNYGDMLVCSALLRQLKLDKVARVSFGATLDRKVDLAIVRGSTYLHPQFNFEAAIKTLQSLDCPLVVVGLGAQHPQTDASFLDGNSHARRFIELLVERSKSIAVRGPFTAEVVARLGGKDLRVCGCPSAFYHRETPQISVSPTLQHKDRRLGISIHSSLRKSIFCRDPDFVLSAHGRVIVHAMKNASSVQIFEQGSAQDFLISDRSTPFERRVEAAQALLERIRIADFVSPQELICRFASIHSVEEWMAKARDHDAFVGFRFHGNMVALTQGIPSFVFVYDSRIQEFCDLYHLPHQSAEQAWQDPLQRILAHDWSETNAAFKRCKDEMVAFWQENEVDHAY